MFSASRGLPAYLPRNSKPNTVVKSKVKELPENNVESQEVLKMNMFWIRINYYPIDSNGLKWSIEFDCASS
jgi:hypothetical protein